jgi:hypothetical protein
LNSEKKTEEIKPILQDFIRTRSYSHLKKALTMLQLSRDANIISKIEERARKENANLKVIIVIFGAIHYENLSNLIRDSSVLSLHAKSENLDPAKWYAGKKIFKIRTEIKQLRCRPDSIMYRQICGKWPQNCNYLPSIRGMLL